MKKNFNDNWQFFRGKKMESITLPHDAMLGEIRSKDAPAKSASGYFPGGKYTYVKEFELSAEEAAGHVTFVFEGVYRRSKVYINDQEAGGAAYGYIPFDVVADGLVQAGSNTIRVEVDNSAQPDSRWYSGAGIYRPVWIEIEDEERITDVKVRTVTIDPPTIEVKTTHEGGEVAVAVLDGETIVAEATGDMATIELAEAELWSEKHPKLYTIRVTLSGGDVQEIPFGIRTLRWDTTGFYVNGEKTPLRGGCIHHDNGLLGAKEYEESAYRKIQILKKNGFNAIRSAHNPCSEAILKACDELGVYIMDETWDMWYKKKSAHDYAENFQDNYKEDLKRLVDKDYNHPSVVMYSIGNEISEPSEEKGVALAKEMTDILHELDNSRAVTGGFNLMIIANAAKGKPIYKEEGGQSSSGDQMNGMNSTMFNMIASVVGPGMNKGANGKKADAVTTPVLDTVDIAGYNYASGRYVNEGKLHPNRIVVGSETFPQDLAKNWEMVKKYPYLIGDFMWTAWDYLGEAGIGAWSYEQDAKGFNKPFPWLLADVGAFDILGNPNGEALWAKAVWSPKGKTYIAVRPVNHPKDKLIKAVWRGTNALPSWTWNGCEGNKATVEVYSRAPQVELTLNGKKVGRKKTKDARAIFTVPYQPGTLKAVSLGTNGEILGETELTTGGAAALQIVPEKKQVKAGEVVYLDLMLADANGVVDTAASDNLTISVENGELLGFGSADPRAEESYLGNTCHTWYGKAQAIVRAGVDGKVRVQVNDTVLEIPIEA